jgi:hypothetical protein
MSFADFQQYEIEIVSDEQTVNDWKEQARNIVTWTTTQEAEQKTFKTLAEVEAHFRHEYLPQELRTGATLETNGAVARASGDRAMNAAIRAATERERGFPVGIVNAMRPILTDAGLHFFKHRKRVVYVSTVRPLRHPAGQPAKDNVLAVLAAIESMPRCTRHDLGEKLLGEHFEAPEKAEEKTALATDLHYLLLAGHVIEFADGRLDLPLPPKAQHPAGGEHSDDQGGEHGAAAHSEEGHTAAEVETAGAEVAVATAEETAAETTASVAVIEQEESPVEVAVPATEEN